VMTSALWGRMKTGRCLEIHPNSLAAQGHDPLFLGCYENVLSVLDEKCSGRASCDVRIADELDNIKPCYPDLKGYLEYSYNCVKGLYVLKEYNTYLLLKFLACQRELNSAEV